MLFKWVLPNYVQIDSYELYWQNHHLSVCFLHDRFAILLSNVYKCLYKQWKNEFDKSFNLVDLFNLVIDPQ